MSSLAGGKGWHAGLRGSGHLSERAVLYLERRAKVLRALVGGLVADQVVHLGRHSG